MGATFFVFFMILFFIIALIFVIISAIRIKTAKREDPGKLRQRLTFWIIIALIPLLYFGVTMLNSFISTKAMSSFIAQQSEETVYAESGKMLFWPTIDDKNRLGNHSGWFEMDGEIYEDLSHILKYENIILDFGEERRGEPIANIRVNPDDRDAFSVFMMGLVGGSFDDGSMSTIYPVINSNHFELYEVNGSEGRDDLFCRSDQLENMLAYYKVYYKNFNNFDTQNLKCEYSAYTKEGEKGYSGIGLKPYKDINADIVFRPGVFEELRRLRDSEQERVSVRVPADYEEKKNAALPGTNIFGYDNRIIRAQSKDNISYMTVGLALIDGRVYIAESVGGGKVTGLPVPEELNQYLIDTVFVYFE